MVFPYGKILRINLSSGEHSFEDIPETLAKEFIGGRGFGAKILFDELPKGVDPLSPENKLIIATGPLNGLLIPGAGKTSFITKGPASGGWADSSLGGHFGTEMRYAGIDAIILEGAASRPSVLIIDDDCVKIVDDETYWGKKGSLETELGLKNDLGADFRIVTTGPAGENLVQFACITGDYGRNAGRCGVGAVMGSKNLKAIAVRGSRDIKVHDAQRVRELYEEIIALFLKNPDLKVWQTYGTMTTIPWAQAAGCLSVRNFSSGVFEHADKIDEKSMREEVAVRDRSCFGCPMSCGTFSESKKHGTRIEGPEYETAALLGANCGVSSMDDIVHANYLCDELGLDTISAGNIIGFVMECFEKGIVTTADLDGIEARFGNSEAVFKLIEKMAHQEGIGKLLSKGVRDVSQTWGQGSSKFAMQVKNLEWTGYETRGAPGMALSYGTADVGAHHNRAWVIAFEIAQGDKRYSSDGKAEKVIELQHIRPMFDQLGCCRLQWVELGLDLEYYPKFLNAVTGWDYSLDDLLKSSERVYNLTRAFNIREGFSRKDDYVPERVLSEPLKDGPAKGHFVKREVYDALLDHYYELRGWSNEGIPTKEKLVELGLLDVAEKLGL